MDSSTITVKARRNRHRASSRNYQKKNSSSSEENGNQSENDLSAAPVEQPPFHVDKGSCGMKPGESEEPTIRERILAFFRRQQSKDYKELIINTEALERRVAMMENGILQALTLSVWTKKEWLELFSAKVQNLDSGLKAAFVDIGQEKMPSFIGICCWLMILPWKLSVKTRKSPRRTSQIRFRYSSGFSDRFSIVVQITKAQIGSKGPRTTTNLSYLVDSWCLCPMQDNAGFPQNRRTLREDQN